MRWASQRAALVIQREIAQADIFQEAKPRPDFLDDLGGDFQLKFSELEILKKFIGFFDGQTANVHDG